MSKSTPGSIANEFFEHKGIIYVIPQKSLEDIDAATALAIDCGANDVTEAEISDGVNGFEVNFFLISDLCYYLNSVCCTLILLYLVFLFLSLNLMNFMSVFQFHCEANCIDSVRQNMESRGIIIYDSCIPYLAIRKVSVSSDSSKLITEMYDRIRDAVDYVDNFYDNCEVVK